MLGVSSAEVSEQQICISSTIQAVCSAVQVAGCRDEGRAYSAVHDQLNALPLELLCGIDGNLAIVGTQNMVVSVHQSHPHNILSKVCSTILSNRSAEALALTAAGLCHTSMLMQGLCWGKGYAGARAMQAGAGTAAYNQYFSKHLPQCTKSTNKIFVMPCSDNDVMTSTHADRFSSCCRANLQSFSLLGHASQGLACSTSGC